MKNICDICEHWLIGSVEEIPSGSYTRFGEEAAVTQKSGKRTTRTESSWRCASVEAPNMVAVEVRILQKEPGFKGAKATWRLQRGFAVTKDMGPGCPFENVGTTAEDKVHRMTQERKAELRSQLEGRGGDMAQDTTSKRCMKTRR